MEALPWLAGLVVAAVVLDRLGVWAESRGWINWRRRSRGSMGEAAGGPLFELFNPGHQHVVTERERQRLDIRQAARGEGEGRDDEPRIREPRPGDVRVHNPDRPPHPRNQHGPTDPTDIPRPPR